MSTAVHSLIRGLCIAAVIALLPLSALFCRGMSSFVSSTIDEFLGSRPRPAITRVVMDGQAHSLGTFYCSIAVAIFLITIAIWFFRMPEVNPWRATGQVFITALAAGVALSLIAVTMFAGFLPFVTIISSMLPE